MGVFSKVMRYRETGEPANVNNVEQYGRPEKSLFISTKVLSLHQATEVTDESGMVVYRTTSKFISLRDKTDVTTASGRQVAHIERKFFSLHERHYVTMENGASFELSNELFHLIKDITNIEGLDWQLRGNIVGLNFQLYDPYGKVIAVISQKFFSIHDKYCIDIYDTTKTDIVVTIVIALQHMIRDRNNSSSAGAGSSSSSS